MFVCITVQAYSLKVPKIQPLPFTEPIYNISNTELLNDLKVLSSNIYDGRKTLTQGNLLAQRFIINSLKKQNISPLFNIFKQPFSDSQMFTKVKGINIAAVVKGTELPEKYIVLTAHYDHLGSSIDGVFNGSDDNASGVVALLHYANSIKINPLKHSVIFLFTDAEEQGLEGAKQFIKSNAPLIKDIKLNINIDMIAGDKNTKHLQYLEYGVLNKLSAPQRRQWQALQAKMPVMIKKGFKSKVPYTGNSKNYWVYVSDHGAFYQQKIPCVYFGVNPHANYHSVNDDYSHANKAFFVKAVEAIYLHLVYLDSII